MLRSSTLGKKRYLSSKLDLCCWLEEAGFGTETSVNIRVVHDSLIITRQAPQRELPSEPDEIEEFIQAVVTPLKRPRRIPDGVIEWRPL